MISRKNANIAFSKAANNFKEMSTISLKGYNDCDLTYFEGGQISDVGLKAYWHGINKSFRDWDKSQMRSTFSHNNHTSPTEIPTRTETQRRPDNSHSIQDRYHWHHQNNQQLTARP